MTHTLQPQHTQDRSTADRRARTWAAGRAGSLWPVGTWSAACARRLRMAGAWVILLKTTRHGQKPASGGIQDQPGEPFRPLTDILHFPRALAASLPHPGPQVPRDKAWEKASHCTLTALGKHLRCLQTICGQGVALGSRKIMFSPKTWRKPASRDSTVTQSFATKTLASQRGVSSPPQV